MIIYDKRDGKILCNVPDGVDPLILYSHYPQEFKDNLAWLNISKPSLPLAYYKVENGSLIRRTDKEIDEIKKYKRILTEEERLNMLLTPSRTEITKAKNTIEILSILQEVGAV